MDVFFVLVVTDLRSLSFDGFGVTLGSAAFFGVLLAVEMAVALLSMLPVARLADRVGFKPVVALGFAVYAVFPVLLIPSALLGGLLFDHSPVLAFTIASAVGRLGFSTSSPAVNGPHLE